MNALVVCRLRATDGNATVISVPSSCSNAAAATHAPSRVHAVRGILAFERRSSSSWGGRASGGELRLTCAITVSSYTT